jgi:myo-inositol-1(or 4)-monophosphatase
MDVPTVMEQAARKAGEMLANNFREKIQVKFKGDRELVTNLDKESEQIIVDTLFEYFPDHSIYSEETESTITKGTWDKGPLWIMDPLDGTANFIHGVGLFCVGIAFYHEGIAEAASIFDPFHDELFTAVKGHGTKLNGQRITVADTTLFKEALLATGFPYHRNKGQDNCDHVANVIPRASDIRRSGSGLLDLAYVACGRFDGYFEHDLGAWDSAPGVLLVQEAGGRVTDYKNERFHPFKLDVCATNGWIHADLIETLQQGTSGFKN